MPIYEYQCKKCNDVFEALLLRPTDEPQPCPACGAGDTEKLLSVTASIIAPNASDMPPMPCPGAGCGLGPKPPKRFGGGLGGGMPGGMGGGLGGGRRGGGFGGGCPGGGCPF